MRWVWRGVALAALVIGWVFIAWQNHFHISAPLVFVCLGYLAVVATVYNLWRTGAVAVASADDEDDSTWARPAGALGELERERRTLLKAIKEAEFDREMGKLSQRDTDDMIAGYKARIYEVYGEIDRLRLGAAGSTREQIMREVRARIEVDARSQKKPGAAADAKPGPGAKRAGKAKKQPAGTAAEPVKPDAAAAPAAAGEAAVADDADADETAAEAAETAAEVAETAAEAAETAAEARAAAAEATKHHDDALEADSTTALESSVEPKRDAAKEATP
ncbi:MAG TPA: hypothetical protein VH165_21785 [Kofleriaceae bacterium]|nr:hypothetical protein [Kofleriaceae bacterium]